MSKKAKNLLSSQTREHGTIGAYTVGFILSLLLTIIPYFLVVNKKLAGTTLLVTILGIAIVQMLIQIFFFLHLGRGPKPLYNVVFFFATAGIIVMVVGASLFIIDNLYRNMSPHEVTVRLAQEEGIAQIGGEKTGACQRLRDNHVIKIENDKVAPGRISAKLCDTLTFVNKDRQEREITFGEHPNHGSYGGIYEVAVSSRRPETITLNQVGDFVFHDHLDPSVTGYMSIKP